MRTLSFAIALCVLFVLAFVCTAATLGTQHLGQCACFAVGMMVPYYAIFEYSYDESIDSSCLRPRTASSRVSWMCIIGTCKRERAARTGYICLRPCMQ